MSRSASCSRKARSTGRRRADRRRRPCQRGWFVGRKLLTRQSRGSLEIYILDLARNATRDAPSHSPGVVEHVIVLAGRAEVGPDGEVAALGEGDGMTFLADRPHRYRPLDGPARLLSLTDYP